LTSVDDQGVVDSGYLARFEEFGYLGFVCYLIVTVGAIVIAIMRAIKARSEAAPRVNAFAVAGAVAVIFAVMDFAVDSHTSIDGVFFWIGVGLICWQPAVELATDANLPKPFKRRLLQFGSQRL